MTDSNTIENKDSSTFLHFEADVAYKVIDILECSYGDAMGFMDCRGQLLEQCWKQGDSVSTAAQTLCEAGADITT